MLERNQSQNNLPELNYIWIGPPKQLTHIMTYGSDVSDVIDMANKCINPINFFCLDEYKDKYKKIFEAYKINVISVEEYLNKILNGKDETRKQYAKKIIEIQKETLNRNRIIDKVSFKDIFSLFILSTKGGYTLQGAYTLDTNIKLNKESKDFAFENYEDFQMPTMSLNIDCWMMYTPYNKLDIPLAMLEFYLSKWESVQQVIRNNERNPEKIYKFHANITGLMIDSIIQTLEKITPQKKFLWEYKMQTSSEQGVTAIATLENPPIIKIYSNSHKPQYEAKSVLIEDINNYINDQSIDLNTRNEFLINFNTILNDNILNDYTNEKENEFYNFIIQVNILFEGFKNLDYIVNQLYNISFAYKSKDEFKQNKSDDIKEIIINAYKNLNQIAVNYKEPNKIDIDAKKSIINLLNKVIKEISKIGDEVMEHHKNKHSISKFSNSRFSSIGTSKNNINLLSPYFRQEKNDDSSNQSSSSLYQEKKIIEERDKSKSDQIVNKAPTSSTTFSNFNKENELLLKSSSSLSSNAHNLNTTAQLSVLLSAGDNEQAMQNLKDQRYQLVQNPEKSSPTVSVDTSNQISQTFLNSSPSHKEKEKEKEKEKFKKESKNVFSSKPK